MKYCPLNGQNLWQLTIFHSVKYCPKQNFIIEFNEILSMDDISYAILSHGHYFRGQLFQRTIFYDTQALSYYNLNFLLSNNCK